MQNDDSPEQDWRDHDKDHERERTVAKETAQRLEREVEQTAQRLERTVEETAIRIENAVATALNAVASTAQVHAEAHAKEHLAHERIHAVEATQVREAKENAKEQAKVLGDSLADYKRESNEWRGSLRDQETKYLRKDEADVKFNALAEGRQANADAIIALRETVLTTFSAQTGKTEGISDTGKFIVAAVGLVGTVLAIVGVVLAISN